MENIGSEIEKVFKKKNYKSIYNSLISQIMENNDIKKFFESNKNIITEEIIQNSFSKLYEFINEKEKSNDPSAPIQGYEPILILNKDFIDISYQPTKPMLLRQKEIQNSKRFTTINMPKDIRDAKITNFQIFNEKDDRSVPFEESIKFIKSYKNNAEHYIKGLYFHGSFGVGKTYLLGAIANKLADDGTAVTLVHFPSLVVDIKQSINNNTTSEIIDRIKKAKVLMIDDIGADSMNTWIRDDILGVVLQFRMQEMLTTFFSSNFSMNQLEADYLRVSNKGDDEPIKAKRIMERIKFLSKEIMMVGENRRNPN